MSGVRRSRSKNKLGIAAVGAVLLGIAVCSPSVGVAVYGELAAVDQPLRVNIEVERSPAMLASVDGSATTLFLRERVVLHAVLVTRPACDQGIECAWDLDGDGRIDVTGEEVDLGDLVYTAGTKSVTVFATADRTTKATDTIVLSVLPSTYGVSQIEERSSQAVSFVWETVFVLIGFAVLAGAISLSGLAAFSISI